MPEGGCLTLRGYLSSVDTLGLDILDTGIGIPEGMDVFEIFRTTKPDGTGLGLPLVSQIVSAHRGRLITSASREREQHSAYHYL